MGIYFSIVEHVFEISGRGLVVVPGNFRKELVVKIGDGMALDLPDGSKLTANIKGIEILTSRIPPPASGRVALLLDSGLTKGMVPVRTKLWMVEHTSSGSA